MNFDLQPSLEDMVFQTISVWMWSETDIKELVLQNYDPTGNNLVSPAEHLDKLKEMEGKIMSRVFKFDIPEHLKRKFQEFVRSVGRQILAWVDFHQHYCGHDVNLPMKFFWTAYGNIDQRKTAKNLVRNNDVEIGIRCAIADIHCLEEFDNLKREIHDTKNDNSIGTGYEKMVLFRNILQALEIDALISNSRDIGFFRSRNILETKFSCSALTANVEATRYYLEKLSATEKEETLERTACFIMRRHGLLIWHHSECWGNYFATVLHQLLSALNNERRMLLIRNHPLEMLKCFSEWSWRHLFQRILKNVVVFLNWVDFNRLLIEMVFLYPRDPRSRKPFFKYVWQEMPQSIKRRMGMERSQVVLLLTDFFLNDDEDCSRMILTDAMDLVGQGFIFGENNCKNLLFISKVGNLFEFFIRTYLTTKESMIKFKGELVDCLAACNQSSNENDSEPTADDYEKAVEILDTYIERCEDENTEIEIEKAMGGLKTSGKNMDQVP